MHHHICTVYKHTFNNGGIECFFIAQACMDEKAIESVGLTPLASRFSSLGGWPMVEGDDWDDGDSIDWANVTAELSRDGFPGAESIVAIAVGPDDRNSRQFSGKHRTHWEICDKTT